MPDGAGRGGRREAGHPTARERPDAWQAALKYLAGRARTTHEVRRALTRRGYPPEETTAVVARLTAARYLDDAEFARTWVSVRAHRGAAAPARLARELRTKGVADGEIASALRGLRDEWDAAAAAGEAAKRKLKSLRGLPMPVARRRLAAFLDRRGFSPEIILATCRKHLAAADESE
jgi:regulatory protein